MSCFSTKSNALSRTDLFDLKLTDTNWDKMLTVLLISSSLKSVRLVVFSPNRIILSKYRNSREDSKWKLPLNLHLDLSDNDIRICLATFLSSQADEWLFIAAFIANDSPCSDDIISGSRFLIDSTNVNPVRFSSINLLICFLNRLDPKDDTVTSSQSW